ncbi:MAG: hypothetical protein ABI622_05370 [Chloroflexota bacterium]
MLVGRLAATAVLLLAACSAPASSGAAQAGPGVRFVAPPGWSVRLDDLTGQADRHLLGWVANVPLDAGCAPGACNRPLTSLGTDGVLVWWFTYNCLPDCALPDEGRTLIGGREAVRELAEGDCGVAAARRELISVRVTPQRTDTLVACSAADADQGRADLESLLDSVRWTVP